MSKKEHQKKEAIITPQIIDAEGARILEIVDAVEVKKWQIIDTEEAHILRSLSDGTHVISNGRLVEKSSDDYDEETNPLFVREVVDPGNFDEIPKKWYSEGDKTEERERLTLLDSRAAVLDVIRAMPREEQRRMRVQVGEMLSDEFHTAAFGNPDAGGSIEQVNDWLRNLEKDEMDFKEKSNGKVRKPQLPDQLKNRVIDALRYFTRYFNAAVQIEGEEGSDWYLNVVKNGNSGQRYDFEEQDSGRHVRGVSVRPITLTPR